jgi:hypothetical protein
MEVIAAVIQAILQLLVAHVAQVLLAMITVTIAATGVYIGYRNWQLNRRRPSLSAFAFGEGVASSLFVCLPFKKGLVFAVPFRIGVTNNGQKSGKNVSCTLEVSDHAYNHELPRSPDKVSKARKVDVVADTTHNRHVAQVLYNLGDIPPGVTLSIDDFVFTDRETVFDHDVAATTRDGAAVTVSVKTIYSLPLTFSIVGEDIQPIKLQVDIQFRTETDGGFDGSIANENALLKKSPRPTQDVTFIRFDDFTMKPLNAELTIAEGVLSSATAVNARITEQGIMARAKPQLRKADRTVGG